MLKRKPAGDVIVAINQGAQSMREFFLLRLSSDFPDFARAHADALEVSADQYAEDVRMALANLVLQVNPAERKRAKRRTR